MELTLRRTMRGEDKKQSSMLMLMSPETRVPQTHPLRTIKCSASSSTTTCSSGGFSTWTWSRRSFDPSAFSPNRDRLIIHDAAGEFLGAIVEQARTARLMSSEHLTVDGTLIEAWASLKSFKKKDDDDPSPPDDPGNPTMDFHGEKRSNETHESTTDPDAKLARKGKGKEAKLSYSAHALIENRNGLVLDLQMDVADGRAEGRNALEMLDNNVLGHRRITVGGDKGFDTSDFVKDCRERNVTPHVAQNITQQRGSNIDGGTTWHVGYAISQRVRKRIEEDSAGSRPSATSARLASSASGPTKSQPTCPLPRTTC
jgi:hypothetical protein